MLLVTSIYLFRNRNAFGLREVSCAAIWLIPGSYLLSYINSASPHLASEMIHLTIFYAIMFTVGIVVTNSFWGVYWLTKGILYSGYCIVIFGIMNLLGNYYFKDAVMLTGDGLRLTSVFQYANAFAAFLIPIILISLYEIVSTKNKYLSFVSAFMLVPLLISFLSTLSRGGIVVFPILFLCFLPFMNIVKQLGAIIYLIISGLMSLLIMNEITNFGTSVNQKIINSIQTNGTATTSPLSETLSHWGLLIGLSLLTALIILFIQFFIFPKIQLFLAEFTLKRISHILIPICLLIIGSVGIFLLFSESNPIKEALPSSIKQRIDNINLEQHSVIERETWNKDSFKLFKDYPFIGAGGGSWAALYEKYQSAPYTSRQVHNFYTQYLVEVGLIGIIILFVIIGTSFYFFIRNTLKSNLFNPDSFSLFIVALSLLLHGAIDFEFSYAYLAGLVFLCLGSLIASGSNTIITHKIRGPVNKWFIAYPISILIISVIVIVTQIRHISAHNHFKSSITLAQSGRPYTEVSKSLDKALSLRPTHPDYVMLQIQFNNQIYQQTKDTKILAQNQQLISDLKQREIYNRGILQEEVNHFISLSQYDQAIQRLIDGLNSHTWDISLYELAINLYYELGKQNSANQEQKLSNWNKAMELYNKVLIMKKSIEGLPPGLLVDKPFGITASISYTIGMIHYLNADYTGAIEILKPNVNENMEESIHRSVARVYLASLNKINKNDESIYNKLITKDPNEANMIASLISTQK